MCANPRLVTVTFWEIRQLLTRGRALSRAVSSLRASRGHRITALEMQHAGNSSSPSAPGCPRPSRSRLLPPPALASPSSSFVAAPSLVLHRPPHRPGHLITSEAQASALPRCSTSCPRRRRSLLATNVRGQLVIEIPSRSRDFLRALISPCPMASEFKTRGSGWGIIVLCKQKGVTSGAQCRRCPMSVWQPQCTTGARPGRRGGSPPPRQRHGRSTPDSDQASPREPA